MKELLRLMGRDALILLGFALVGTAIVAITFSATEPVIAENQRQAVLANLNALIPHDQYDNALTEDVVQIVDRQWLGTDQPVTIYRAFKNGNPVALVADPVAPDGYGGPIRLLVGVWADGTVAGVRVLAHQETPGLGDKIELSRSDWILTFDDRSLGDPPPDDWAVKKDGGYFDQFTGATITPRAVVGTVYRFLRYFDTHRDQLFATGSDS